eukprot:SAG31_NODE_10997_length_1075_cov_0.897541_2_plen_92_part_01
MAAAVAPNGLPLRRSKCHPQRLGHSGEHPSRSLLHIDDAMVGRDTLHLTRGAFGVIPRADFSQYSVRGHCLEGRWIADDRPRAPREPDQECG